MAFNQYFFQFGSYVFPNKYIKLDSYDIAPNQRQDLDSYTDGNGLTHRNALEHTKTQIQFTVMKRPESVHEAIMSSMRANYINYKERDANCVYYDPETCQYKTGHFYLDPSVSFRMERIKNGILFFGETQFLFIEY